jgi:hypothetical protein
VVGIDQGRFDEEYFRHIWQWYENGGVRHVAAYLAELDISDFDAKAPPPQTEAFWAIVDANRAPEDAELADVLDRLDNPDAVTLSRIESEARLDFGVWLSDRRNRRLIPHRFESCGYVPVRNGAAKDGQFVVQGRRQRIYAKATMSAAERLRAARKLERRSAGSTSNKSANVIRIPRVREP